jgi:hypothetical protein
VVIVANSDVGLQVDNELLDAIARYYRWHAAPPPPQEDSMPTVPAEDGHEALAASRYARVAGAAMLLSIVFGLLGEMILPDKIVGAGPAATAANILGHPEFFRLTFAAYLVEAFCDVALCVLFYILLKPVNKQVALLSAFFGIAAMLTYAIGQSSFYASSLVLGDSPGMTTFSPDQRNALAYLALRISGTIGWLFLWLYGVATILRGCLIARSTYLPKIFGILLVIGGAGFILRSVTYLLAPRYSSMFLLMPMALAGIALMLWLLIRGIDPARVQAQAGRP